MPVVLTDSRGNVIVRRPRPAAIGTGVSMAQQSPIRPAVTALQRRENQQISGPAWRTVTQKAAALEANVPYIDGALVSMADYLGAVTPDPATTDVAWNAEVREWLGMTLLMSRESDASGKFLWPEFQKQMWRYHDRDGDCLVVFTRLEPDNPNSRPVLRLVPALGVDSPAPMGMPQRDWIDGVKLGLHHRPLAYHILAEESAVNYPVPVNRAGYIVDGANCFHFANFRNVGGTRGRTRFMSTSGTVIDLATMDSATHRMFDLAAKLGAVLTMDKDGAPAAAAPLSGDYAAVPAYDSDAVSAADEEEQVQFEDRVKESFTTEGTAVINLAEEPGLKMEMQNLAKVIPDVAAVRSGDLERIAMSYGLPVQILFCIYSGVFNLTGPGFRVSLTRAQKWRHGQLARMQPLVQRHYSDLIAWGIATRQIPRPKKDWKFWRARMRWEKDYTIDEGRDVNLDQKRLEIGATTEAEIASEYGRDIAEVVKERAEFVEMVIRTMGDNAACWGGAFADAAKTAANKEDGRQMGGKSNPS